MRLKVDYLHVSSNYSCCLTDAAPAPAAPMRKCLEIDELLMKLHELASHLKVVR